MSACSPQQQSCVEDEEEIVNAIREDEIMESGDAHGGVQQR
jgi:hypothetical protein